MLSDAHSQKRNCTIGIHPSCHCVFFFRLLRTVASSDRCGVPFALRLERSLLLLADVGGGRRLAVADAAGMGAVNGGPVSLSLDSALFLYSANERSFTDFF